MKSVGAFVVCGLMPAVQLATAAASFPELYRVDAGTEVAIPDALCAQANPVLTMFTQFANAAIGEIISNEIDLFGKPDNHLDPLDFNDQLRAYSKGEACIPKKCATIFGKKICTKEICVGGEAEAKLVDLKGLESLNVEAAQCATASIDESDNSRIHAKGILDLSIDSLTGSAKVAAHAKLGIKLPVSASGTLKIVDIAPRIYVDVVLTVENKNGGNYFQVESITASEVSVPFERVKIEIDNIKYISKMVSGITNAVTQLVRKRVEEPISDILSERLNGVMGAAVERVNGILKFMPF
eukprot:CFRG0155T1